MAVFGEMHDFLSPVKSQADAEKIQQRYAMRERPKLDLHNDMFVQIETGPLPRGRHTMYGLDERGNVWQFDELSQEWLQVSMVRAYQ